MGGQLSSVSLWLLWDEVVLLLSIIDELDGVGVLSPSDWLLPLLIGNEWFSLIEVIDFSLSVSQMVPLVKSSPDW